MPQLKKKPTTVVVYHVLKDHRRTTLPWALEQQLQLDDDVVSCCPRVDLLHDIALSLKGGPQVIEVLVYRVTSLDRSLLPGTRKTTTLMETVSNCSEVTLGCLSSALNAPGVEWHSSSSSAEHCSQALISVWCCQRTSTSTPVCDSSALSVTTCWRHSKLSS